MKMWLTDPIASAWPRRFTPATVEAVTGEAAATAEATGGRPRIFRSTVQFQPMERSRNGVMATLHRPYFRWEERERERESQPANKQILKGKKMRIMMLVINKES